jgi:hypothetical protein
MIELHTKDGIEFVTEEEAISRGLDIKEEHLKSGLEKRVEALENKVKALQLKSSRE